MNSRPIVKFAGTAMLLLMLLALSHCGQKGALTRPEAATITQFSR